VVRPSDRADGQANGALALAKKLGLQPREVAQQVLDAAGDVSDMLVSTEIAGPGFINLVFSNTFIAEQLSLATHNPRLGVRASSDPHTVVVDYSAPNVAKEMHVGHLRGTIIGQAIVNLHRTCGFRVVGLNHLGDWGTQFGMLLAQLDDDEKQQPDSLRQLSDLETFYIKAKHRFDNDPLFAQKAREWVVLLQSGNPQCLTYWHEFIQLSLAHCQTLYARLNVLLTPVDVCAESFYNNMLPEIVATLREKQLLEECEGAQCVFLTEFKGKNDERLPIIVQKKDGGFLYASTDLAAVAYRQHTLHANRVLYVVDARQALHFQQIFLCDFRRDHF
jgi:arginyl-tRNA synthetase